MNTFSSFLCFVALTIGSVATSMAQCASCEPDLSCVAVDFPVLCPEQLPNATQGEPYSATATFNLPPSVVDPGSGLEATLLTVTISQVTGLPFGLEFSPNNPDGVYQPENGEYYGCSVVCGTPLVSGSFFVDINVVVLVSAFGFQQTVNESFSLPLIVEPGNGGDGPSSFELNATQGCVPFEIQGTNLIADNGASYLWDFGNGQTSTAFNPTFTYNTPGTYTVNVQTEVSELALTQVNITTLGGGWGGDVEDFFGLGAPDPYFVLSGPQGGIYTSDYAEGNETPTLGGFSIPLDPGTTYNIAFYDSDGVLTSDDFLGSSNFTPAEGGDITVSNSTTAILTLTETVVASFNESTQVVVFDGLEVYQDLDGDGFGDPDVLVNACDPNNDLPYAFNDQDCADDNANVYAGAVGTGEGLDNNCDGVVDGAELMTVLGCTVAEACNYDPAANTDDGSCTFSEPNFDCDGNCTVGEDCEGTCGGTVTLDDCGVCGGDNASCSGCTDPAATNYDPSALVEDGTCEFPECLGDLNGDLLVSVADILEMLGDFGCVENCDADLTGDNAVSVEDLLTLLANFGLECPE
ncbi:MAG: PKD domain-containing protein [Bacteroidota bacterium]|nr:PKD domain-containing protein [Bacteroidota bacterium]